MRAFFEIYADLVFLLRLLQCGVKQHPEKGNASNHNDPPHLCRFLCHFVAGQPVLALSLSYRALPALDAPIHAECTSSDAVPETRALQFPSDHAW
jgi:hypothetical protein